MLVVETMMAVGLCCGPLKRSNSKTHYAVCTSERAELVQVSTGNSMESQMLSDIEKIEGVLHAEVSRSGDTFDVSVLIDSMDFPKFDAVVQEELRLYVAFPQFTFHFDINPIENTDAA
jgi:hypothetical protein